MPTSRPPWSSCAQARPSCSASASCAAAWSPSPAARTALHAVLLQVLSRFHRENPPSRLRVSNQSAPEAIDALRSGLAELAVVTMPPAPLSAPLEAMVLASFREVAVCSTAFPLDSGRTFTLREIAALPLIALRRGTSTFDLYESLFRRHGLSYAPGYRGGDLHAAACRL